MPEADRVTVSEAIRLQRRVLLGERRMAKLVQLCDRAERELTRARGQLQAATANYLAAKAELERIGLVPGARGIPIDADGYVAVKKPLKLVK